MVVESYFINIPILGHLMKGNIDVPFEFWKFFRHVGTLVKEGKELQVLLIAQLHGLFGIQINIDNCLNDLLAIGIAHFLAR